MAEPIRILIADDHPIVRDGLATVLGTQPDFLVVGEASTGAELVERAPELRPDVVLVDLEMPDVDGAEAIRRLAAVCPGARALVFTAFDTDERILEAVRAGARGYLLKGVPRASLFAAIREVSQGKSLLQPAVASKLMRMVAGGRAEPMVEELTRREREVLALLAQGKANKEIAAALGISPTTAKFHVRSILGKLGASNRTEAVTRAAQQGLITLS